MGWVGRVTSLTGTAVVLGLATAAPAWADSTISINPGNVPTEATGHNCDSNFGGGPYADRDVWVFVLPKPQQAGKFLSVTATFKTDGGSVTLTIPDDGGAIVNDKGASKAWIATTAGWELTGATAEITGSSDRFNLTHTCAAGGNGGGHSPSASASASPSAEASTAPGVAGGGSGGSASGGGLPVTGAAVTSIALTGGLLVAGGTALVLLRRRRDLAFAAAGGDSSGSPDEMR